jgi:hypothetical protein
VGKLERTPPSVEGRYSCLRIPDCFKARMKKVECQRDIGDICEKGEILVNICIIDNCT